MKSRNYYLIRGMARLATGLILVSAFAFLTTFTWS